MGVEEELKRKRTELLNSMEQLALGIETIKKQDIALPVALVKLNKSAAILKVLHEAGEPLSSAGLHEPDCREAWRNP